MKNLLVEEMNKKKKERISLLLNIVQGKEDGDMVAAIDEIMEGLAVMSGKVAPRFARQISTNDIDRDDLKQEFLFGAYNAIETTNALVGDPFRFLVQKGTWALVDRLRKSYRQQVRQYCNDCHQETALCKKDGESTCPRCGSKEVSTINKMKLDNPTNTQEESEQIGMIDSLESNSTIPIEEAIASSALVTEFQGMLTGRKKEVFDLVYYEGYNRDNCQNYIKEIAEIMGITPQNVNLRLRQIKKQWQLFVEQQQELDELEEMYDYER